MVILFIVDLLGLQKIVARLALFYKIEAPYPADAGQMDQRFEIADFDLSLR